MVRCLLMELVRYSHRESTSSVMTAATVSNIYVGEVDGVAEWLTVGGFDLPYKYKSG